MKQNFKNLSRVSNWVAVQTWLVPLVSFKILTDAQFEPVFDGSYTRFKFFNFGLSRILPKRQIVFFCTKLRMNFLLKIKICKNVNPTIQEILESRYFFERGWYALQHPFVYTPYPTSHLFITLLFFVFFYF